MSPKEYWDLNVFAAGVKDWRDHPTVARTVSLLAGIVTFLAAYVFVSEPGTRFWSRVLTGVIALATSAVVLGVLFVFWVWFVVPYRQRGEASKELVKLNAYINERNKVEFKLKAWTEEIGALGAQIGKEQFRGHCTLWVEVANEGRVAEFAARIPRVQLSVVRLPDLDVPDEIQVYNVAWEQTLHWRRDLGVGRLMLGNVAIGRSGSVFWFFTAENARWNPEGHGVGHRLRPTERVIEFPLIVTNITDRKELTRTCRLTFDENLRTVEAFDFVD